MVEELVSHGNGTIIMGKKGELITSCADLAGELRASKNWKETLLEASETTAPLCATGEYVHEELVLEHRVEECGAAEEYDDNTGVHLGPEKVVLGKMKELHKLREREVYPYVDRDLDCGMRPGNSC